MIALATIVVIGLIGGVAIGLQAPLSSIINQRLGILESVFIVHLGGLLVAGIPLAILGGGNLGMWRTVPWYALAAGFLGMIVISSTVYMVPRIGVAGAIVLIIAGQLTIAATIDHFGALQVDMRAFTPQRLIGLSVVILGVWLTVRN